MLDPRVPCAAYELPLSRPLREPGEFCLLKIPANPSLPVTEVHPGWGLEPGADSTFWSDFSARAEVLRQLEGCLERLPEDVLALGCSQRTVACYWREKTDEGAGAIDAIKNALSMVAIPMTQWFETAPPDNPE